MANYFTNFSIVLPLKPEQAERAMQLANQVLQYRNENQPVPDDFPANLADALEDWTFETESIKEGVWLHTDCGGVDGACQFIQYLLQQFNFAPSVSFEWSHDCSQPRTDAYGGGAAFVTADKIETFNTSQWLASKLKP